MHKTQPITINPTTHVHLLQWVHGKKQQQQVTFRFALVINGIVLVDKLAELSEGLTDHVLQLLNPNNNNNLDIIGYKSRGIYTK